MKKFLSIILLLIAVNLYAEGRRTPFNVCVFPPISLFQVPKVSGIDLNIIQGKTESVYGIQTGLIGDVRKEFYGLQLNIFANRANLPFLLSKEPSMIENDHPVDSIYKFYGIQISFINASYCANGIQLSCGNIGEYFRGIQIGIFYNFTNHAQGIQIAGISNTFFTAKVKDGMLLSVKPRKMKEFSGLQFALFNVVENVKGIQLGVFNYADNLRGVQIGVLNIAKNSKIYPYMIGINAGW
jgi:hypothetical protein